MVKFNQNVHINGQVLLVVVGPKGARGDAGQMCLVKATKNLQSL